MSSLPFAAQNGPFFHHEAFLYVGADHFLAGTTAFVHGALEAGEDVLVAVADPRAALLRDALGHDADRVEFLDLTAAGRNPARIIPLWQDWVDRHASGGRGFRGIGEPVWADRTACEIVEGQQHEQLLGTAFGQGPAWWLLCPYDVAALPAAVIERVHASHPSVVDGDVRRASASYPHTGSEAAVMAADPLEEPAGPVYERGFDMAALAELRDLVAGFAEPVVGEGGAANAVLVVSELAANSIKYGGGAGTLRLWRDGASLVCEVRDDGLITDPLAGRRRPSLPAGGKAGLWIANQLCDLLQIRSAPGRGTVVRAWLSDVVGG